jgi:hypothetical protein
VAAALPLLALGCTGSSDEDESPPPAFPEPGPPPEGGQEEGLRPPEPPKPTDEATWQALITKAKRSNDKTVPVIIALKVDVQPASNEQRELRNQIREKRNAVLNRLKGTKVTNVKTFDIVPALAAHVGADALAELRKSSEVAAVSEDRASPSFDAEAEAGAAP